jgi:hypothetical protein
MFTYRRLSALRLLTLTFALVTALAVSTSEGFRMAVFRATPEP